MRIFKIRRFLTRKLKLTGRRTENHQWTKRGKAVRNKARSRKGEEIGQERRRERTSRVTNAAVSGWLVNEVATGPALPSCNRNDGGQTNHPHGLSFSFQEELQTASPQRPCFTGYGNPTWFFSSREEAEMDLLARPVILQMLCRFVHFYIVK
ncbi:hypothetical protein OUZ56_007121 [Daphnia magna]|uniref:Uncharacterized protein n=1 Tax=Daphnia magna TaxID=35525 RepID=A0ABQ9YXM5_9CRUS|nr:hypothetical protein OUZ56_007121 [Daphnia magna]